MKTLLIDNYDSYAHILANLLWKVNGEKPLVFKNNAVTIQALRGLDFDNIVISPGPGHPANARDVGVAQKLFDAFPDIPLLGVCLGHQGLALHAGATIRPAPSVMHGKTSKIHLSPCALFKGLPRAITAMRYHSWIVDARALPKTVRVMAKTSDGLVMALRRTDRPFWGLQFHPESAGTEQGEKILVNFRDFTRQWKKERVPKPTVRFFREPLGRLDAETAFVGLFSKERHAFWLDSAQPQSGAAFSYMGAGRPAELGADPFQSPALNQMHQKSAPFDFSGGRVGYFSYEMKRHLGLGRGGKTPEPEQFWLNVDRFIALDHRTGQAWACMASANARSFQAWVQGLRRRIKRIKPATAFRLIRNASSRPVPPSVTVRPRLSRARYQAAIRAIQKDIRRGETYEACLTNQFEARLDLNPLRLYRVLRRANSAPYCAYLKAPGFAVLSSSPELFLKVSPDGMARTEPIKGTRPLGRNAKETRELARELEHSGKDRSELMMVVDLLRNDLARVCRPGSVRVERLRRVTRHATLLQLSSVITGRLKQGQTALDLVRAAFPGGSVTGAPKPRTLEILDRLERGPRGVYTGAIGYLSHNGAAALNIAIRTLVWTKGTVRFGAGGGIVHQSDPAREWNEIMVKAHPLIKALCLAKTGRFGYDAIVGESDD